MQNFISVRIRNKNDAESSWLGEFSPEYLPLLVKLVREYGFESEKEGFASFTEVVGKGCCFVIVVGEK